MRLSEEKLKEYRTTIGESWKLFRKYSEVQKTDDYWHDMVAEVSGLTLKYKSGIADLLAYQIIQELSDIDRFGGKEDMKVYYNTFLDIGNLLKDTGKDFLEVNDKAKAMLSKYGESRFAKRMFAAVYEEMQKEMNDGNSISGKPEET